MNAMTRTTLLCAALIAALVSTNPAMARPIEEGFRYLGLQQSNVSFRSDRTRGTTTPQILSVRAGYFLFDYVSAELRYGTGIKNDRVSAQDGTRIGVSVDRFAAGYLLGHIPLATNSSFYVFGGISHFQGTFARPESELTDSEEGGSFGAGYQINFGRTFGLNLEYARYFDQGGNRLTGYTVGAHAFF